MGHSRAVESNLGKFQQLGCQVVIIANGTKEEGMVWQKEHRYNFPTLTDPKWLLYRKLGLRRYVDFLTTEVVIAYGEGMVGGVPLPKLTYDDDDLCIMGGDFIVQKDGKLVYALKQQTINQRPTVEELLLFLQQQAGHNLHD